MSKIETPLDPNGALSRPITIDGKRVPLWNALYDASEWKSDPDDPREKPSHDVSIALFNSYSLSLVDRLDAAIDISRSAYGLYGYDLVPHADIVRDEAVAQWARAHVERLAKVSKDHSGGRCPNFRVSASRSSDREPSFEMNC